MAVTEAELAAVLNHCRSLLDAAERLATARMTRGDEATQALGQWRGPYAEVFAGEVDAESRDWTVRVAGFRAEADEWAWVWADTVNRINRTRREAAVDEISSQRGFGETLVDLAVGDDSGEQVREFEPVGVPVAATRYRATGGLESF